MHSIGRQLHANLPAEGSTRNTVVGQQPHIHLVVAKPQKLVPALWSADDGLPGKTEQKPSSSAFVATPPQWKEI
jgi:hypothetical protein